VKQRRGRVETAVPIVEGQRLKVRMRVLVDGEGSQTAYLPEREVAALLPRSVLPGPGLEAPDSLLQSLEAILSGRIRGRTVRLWSYRERSYASFLPWRSVRFVGHDHELAVGTDGHADGLKAAQRSPAQNMELSEH
jgi:hypothetical protein